VCVTGLTEGGATETFSRPDRSVSPYCWLGGVCLYLVLSKES
jgi:hypothetical protein